MWSAYTIDIYRRPNGEYCYSIDKDELEYLVRKGFESEELALASTSEDLSRLAGGASLAEVEGELRLRRQ